MGTKERRSFSEEFKRDAVRRAEAGGHSFTHIARELGIHPSLLQTWRRKHLPHKLARTRVPHHLDTVLRRQARVEGATGLDDAIGEDQELAHRRSDDIRFLFATRMESAGEGRDGWIVLHGHDRRKVEKTP